MAATHGNAHWTPVIRRSLGQWLPRIGCLVAVVGASTGVAQPPQREGRGTGRGNPVVAALDTDGDGSLSAAEMDAAPKQLRSLDANQDGTLSPDEVRPMGGPPGGGPGGFQGGFPGGGASGGGEEMVTRLMEYDRDKDGTLKADEVPERMRAIITRADSNGDGAATREELLAATRSQGGGQRRGEGGEGRRDGERGMRGEPGAFVDRMFEQYDTDKDGKLSREELAAMRAPGGAGGGFGGREGEGPRRGEGGGRRPPLEE